jgi:hypothetical protein
MAEIFVQFATVLSHSNGRSYVPHACGRLMEDGRRWEGWIEFVPDDTSPVLRTPRETVQPKREDLEYWAGGLTAAYLEGALERALESPPAVPMPSAPAQASYEGPAPSTVHVSGTSAPPVRPRALLNPLRVYAQGEDVLRKELTALHPSHLRTIVRAYDLVQEEELDLEHMTRAGLADLIVAAVRKRLG